MSIQCFYTAFINHTAFIRLLINCFLYNLSLKVRNTRRTFEMLFIRPQVLAFKQDTRVSYSEQC